MTEKKRYYRTNMNLVDEQYNPYYSIKDRETDKCLFTVTGKYTSKDIVDLLNEKEDKLKRIEKEVNNCNIYRDDLKDIILEIRCILNGDV